MRNSSEPRVIREYKKGDKVMRVIRATAYRDGGEISFTCGFRDMELIATSSTVALTKDEQKRIVITARMSKLLN